MGTCTRLLPIDCTDKGGHPFSIRLCTPEGGEYACLGGLYEAFEPKEAFQGLPPRRADSIKAWLAGLRDRGLHLVAQMDGEVVGHAALLEIEPGDRCEFVVFVRQDHQDRGIGTALCRVSCGVARECGYKSMWLTVEASNHRAARVYHKAGFRLVGPPDVEMEMRLDLTSLPDGS